jgi:hypothetical protein
MTYRLSRKPKEIRWKLVVKEPDEKRPGEHKSIPIFVTFVQMGTREFEAAKVECAGDDVALLRRIMTGWEINDENGLPYDFSNDEHLLEVIDKQHMYFAILRGYNDFLSGGALRGN